MDSYEYDSELELEYDPVLELLCDFVRREEARPKTLVVDPNAALKMTRAMKIIRKLLKEEDIEYESFQITYFMAFRSVGVHIDMDSFTCYKMSEFAEVLEDVSTIEFCPLTNGKIRLGFTISHYFFEVE